MCNLKHRLIIRSHIPNEEVFAILGQKQLIRTLCTEKFDKMFLK